MPRRFAPLLLMLAAFAAAHGAFAQGSNEGATRLFARLDRDRNGAVTAREFAFVRSIDFRRLDRNNDGSLSRQEFIDKRSPPNSVSARARRLRSQRIRRYAEIDSDGDGRIARAEYMDFGRRLFARLDRNGNAELTLSEVRAGRARNAPSAKRRQAGGLFGQIDGNGDGAISLGELLAARRIVFKRLDADGNGAISVAEFAAREAAIVSASGRAPPPFPAVPARASRRFLQLDRDNDGRITVDEYLADGKARFAAADRDANGRLDRAEFAGGAGG